MVLYTLKGANMIDNHKRKVKRLKNLFMLYGTILGSLISTSEYKDDKMVDVDSEYNYAMEYYYNHSFEDFNNTSLHFCYSPVDNSLIDMLPHYIEKLNLKAMYFISDLSKLPEKCPNITYLKLNICPNITNYDFIYSLPNLKEVYLYSPTDGINQELVDYLNSKGIKHNITHEMIDNIKTIDNIYNSIIHDGMSENEKVNAITSYVVNNIAWDLEAHGNKEKVHEYNVNPLKYALEGKGICPNYSYLFQCLCSRANIYSNIMSNYTHEWNLVKIDDKYYYIDSTNINQLPSLTNKLLEKDLGFYYKQDPYDTTLSYMQDIDDLLIPEDLLNEIKKSEKYKSLIERYGSNLGIDMILLSTLLFVPIPFIPVKSKRESEMKRKLKK